MCIYCVCKPCFPVTFCFFFVPFFLIFVFPFVVWWVSFLCAYVLFFLIFVSLLNVFDIWLPCFSSVLIHYSIYLQFSYRLPYRSAVQCSSVCACWVTSSFCHPRDCSLPDSSVHGIFQARLLEWVFAFFFFLMLFYGILSLYLFIPVIVFWSLVIDSQWQDNTTVKSISCVLVSNYSSLSKDN